MENYMRMSTTIRHNKITATLYSRIIDFVERGAILALQEECALVHWGSRIKPEPPLLIDLKNIENINNFKEEIIDDLDYVQPDFLLFHKNSYVENKKRTRTAGCPDLIVEVWSNSNTDEEKKFKYDLYSSSDVTEHWYIEQDSNDVICYFGRDRIENKSLTDILVTRGGLKFDLRYLAI